MNFGTVLAALTVVLSMGSGATFAANNNGQPIGPTQALSIPNAYNTPILTYSAFNSGTCSQAAFSVNATGNDAANGTVDIQGTTTLDGTSAGAFAFSLGPGPFTFPTSFSRNFTPPPPASSTYTFVFNSNVFQAGNFLGTSVTTITCAAGVFNATNVWVAASSIPTLSEWGLALLPLVIAAAAVVLFRRQSVARG